MVPPAPSIRGPEQVIAARGPVRKWLEPWYGAYGVLGALASGFAALLIPLVIAQSGGSALQIGAAIAAQNIGALSAPLWGAMADRTKAYRAIFFSGFIVMAAGFAGYSLLAGIGYWVLSAFLIGFGTGASNTVATLFVVEFTPRAEWSPRISWLQTFNASGSVLGMAAAGFLSPRIGMAVAALLVAPALILGGKGLPVPGGRFHVPHVLTGAEIRALLRHGGPSAASLHQHHWRPRHLLRLAASMRSPFGLFLLGWFALSLAVSSFSSLYPVLMQKSFAVQPAYAAGLMSLATAISIPLYNLAGRLTTRLGASATLVIGYLGRMVPMAAMAALAYFHPGFGTWGSMVLFGIFQGIWPFLSVASNDLAASLAPFGEGPSIGIFSAAAAVASALGAVLGGGIADHLGYSAVPAFAAAVIVLALLTIRRRPGVSR